MSNIIPFEPGLTPATIAEEEVTIPRLSGLLDMAFFEYEIDSDGDIYIIDGVDFPIWVVIDCDRKFLHLSTFIPVDGAREATWMARVNDMNKSITVAQFHYKANAVYGSYWMTFAGGLNVRQFVRMLRTFSGAFLAGIKRHMGDPVEPRTPSA